MTRWIPIEWAREDEFLSTASPHRVTVAMMVSPFYPGRRYAVRLGGLILARDGRWEWEAMPSDRDDAFYTRCRFLSFKDARIAAEAQLLMDEPPPPAMPGNRL